MAVEAPGFQLLVLFVLGLVGLAVVMGCWRVAKVDSIISRLDEMQKDNAAYALVRNVCRQKERPGDRS